MSFLFYDVVPTNIVRFYSEVIYELRKSSKDDFHFLFEHDDKNNIDYVRSAYEFAKNIDYCQWKSVDWFKNYFIQNNIKVLFINGQRIADDRVVLAAKTLGIKTYMIQHGMYIPFMKRDIQFFSSKIKKTFSFLFYAYDISRKQNNIAIIYKYFMSYVIGINQVRLKIDRRLLNVDTVFVYSDYWKGFHKKQFGYSEENQVVVGTPDLADLPQFLEQDIHKDTVCYIAQTLVEDGRLKKEVQLEFYKKLVDATELLEQKLLVKLHPRNDKSLFNYSKNKLHVSLILDYLPKSEFYIGHYSTLLSKGLSVPQAKVFIYEYFNHPTPDYFEMCSDAVIRDVNELVGFLSGDRATRVEKEDIHNVFCPGINYSEKIVSLIKTS